MGGRGYSVRAAVGGIFCVVVLSGCSYTGEASWELGGTTPDESGLFVWYEEGRDLREFTVSETDASVTVDVEVGRLVGPQNMMLEVGFELIELEQPLADRELLGCGHDDCRAPGPSLLAPHPGRLRVADERMLVSIGSDDVILDTATGEPVSDAPAGEDGTVEAPTVLNGTATVRTEETGLFIEDAVTGEPVLILSLLPATDPLVQGDLVILGVRDDGADNGLSLDAYDAGTGELEWRRPLPDDELAAAGGQVFYPEGSEVVAVQATTGEERFRVDVFLAVGSLTARTDRVYASIWQGAAAIDAEQGALLWWWQHEVGLHTPG